MCVFSRKAIIHINCRYHFVNHQFVIISLTRCGTTVAIDPVREKVTSESSMFVKATHGQVSFSLTKFIN